MDSVATDSRYSAKTIFFASCLALFLELALIRWVSCEIRIFAYFKNLVLIACFLGFGTGCFLSHKTPRFGISVLLLLLLSLLIELPWQPLLDYGPARVSRILADMPGLMIYRATQGVVTWARLPSLLFAIGWSVTLFFLLALIMVPFGQVIASSVAALANPLRAYSMNVAGSLAGILGYTLATSMTLPPVCWFVPVALLCAWLVSESHRMQILLTTLALMLVLLPGKNPQQHTYWSSYQKLQLEGDKVFVNNMGYQGLWKQPDLTNSTPPDWNGTTMPYAVRRPPGRVLIIGGGAGNDAAAALSAGATSVTAVEIDRVILDIGRRLHPQQPYSDPRVRVVLDDARHFLRTSQEQFDLIVFSHLDSHTVLSSYTNVRLDDYIYTVESLREARKLLAPKGILYLVFWSEQSYVTARLGRNLFSAFDNGPFALVREGVGGAGKVQLVFLFAAEPDTEPLIRTGTSTIPGFQKLLKEDTSITPSTDRWPFLALSEPHIPMLVVLLSTLILVLCAGFAWRSRPPGEPFDGRMFWLGAAFLLVEVHNVSRLALVFGVTWQVNAWVIGAILTVILFANWLTVELKRRQRDLRKGMYVGLFVSLAVAYFLPLQLFLGKSYLLGGVIATLILTLPIFFAALVFADAFSESATPQFSLGWNVLGAAVGGLAESLSYVFGIPSLVLVAAVFYAIALLWRNPIGKKATTKA